MHVFDGYQLAEQREVALKQTIAAEFPNKKLTIAAVLFSEDAGSRLYTKLKGEAAQRVGINYKVITHSVSDPVSQVVESIKTLNSDPEVTGIIIQKPYRKTWKLGISSEIKDQIEAAESPRSMERKLFADWWNQLTAAISEDKDVDGLHPNTISQIKDGTWRRNGKVLPATCKAVLTILSYAHQVLPKGQGIGKHLLLGKSDLLGVPLYHELKRLGFDVELLAKKELDKRKASGKLLKDGKVIVSATGVKDLISAEMLSDNVVIIDVGEPRADVDFDSVSNKAAFITPVPGGVGPMTVVSLLENCLQLAKT